MTCRSEELIETYCDGELDGAERLALESHLEACEGCRRVVRAARALKTATRRVPVPAMPAELLASLRAEAARARKPARASSLWAVLWERRPAVYGLAAGFAAAAAVIALRVAEPPTVTLPLDVLLAAHGDSARDLPLAPQDKILAELRLEGLQ